MARLRLVAELDIAKVRSVDELVQPVILTSPSRLVVHVSGLQFADSSGDRIPGEMANQIRHVEIREPSLLLRRMIRKMGLAERLRVSP